MPILVMMLAVAGIILTTAAQAASPDTEAAPVAGAGTPAAPVLGETGPIVGGKKIQPRAHVERGKSSGDAAPLLRHDRTPPVDDGPIVQPRDIYGNSLGGNPGLDEPALRKGDGEIGQ